MVMFNSNNIFIIDFKDCGIDMVAVFDQTKISEKEVKQFLVKQYPIGCDTRIIFTSKAQWETVFGGY